MITGLGDKGTPRFTSLSFYIFGYTTALVRKNKQVSYPPHDKSYHNIKDFP